MTNLVTNNKINSASSINVNDNLTNIAIGDKLLIDAGIINTVILGSWNRLVAGVSTVIQLGTKMNATLANTIKVTRGDYWHYSPHSYDISENALKTANNQFDIAAGASDFELDKSIFEQPQIKLILFGTIASFVFIVGISLLGIQYSPFKTTRNSGNGNTSTDPSTGEIIDIDNVGIEFDPKKFYSIVSGALTVLLVLVCQWLLAKRMANQRLSSKLSLSTNKISALTLSAPNNPQQSDFAAMTIGKNDNDKDSQISFVARKIFPSNWLRSELYLGKYISKDTKNTVDVLKICVDNNSHDESSILLHPDKLEIKTINSQHTSLISMNEKSTILGTADTIILATHRQAKGEIQKRIKEQVSQLHISTNQISLGYKESRLQLESKADGSSNIKIGFNNTDVFTISNTKVKIFKTEITPDLFISGPLKSNN